MNAPKLIALLLVAALLAWQLWESWKNKIDGGRSERPCVPPRASDRERGSAPSPVLIDGAVERSDDNRSRPVALRLPAPLDEP